MPITTEVTYRAKEFYYFVEDLGTSLSLPLQMIQIPSGSFMMGAPEQEKGSSSDEKPQHRVNIQSFFMGRYPVTQEQWKAIAEKEDLKVSIDLDLDPSNFKENYEGISRWKRPVEKVSWEEAMEYCARLSKLTGRPYSLPSEAQWEYACRAGTTTPFHFGETISTDLANYNGSSEKYGAYGRGLKGIYRKQTTPVDYFNAPNAFGLSDMHGNVWEWCADDYVDNYEETPRDGSAYKNESMDYSVLRGGSWINYPNDCRSADRFYITRDDRYGNFGFRVLSGVGRTS